MGPTVATGGSFDILQDEVACPAAQTRIAYPSSLDAGSETRDALQELPFGRVQYQNAVFGLQCLKEGIKPLSTAAIAVAADRSQSPSPSDSHPKLPRRSARHRRPPVEWETFEPLDAVVEETSAVHIEAPLAPGSSRPARAARHQAPFPDTAWQQDDRLSSLDANYDVQEQVAKHLAGQFEWIMTYPALATSTEDQPESAIYGCNMLRRINRWSSAEHHDIGPCAADSYALLATPLTDVALLPCDKEKSGICLAPPQPPWYPDGPLKAPGLVTVVEEVLSPSLSAVSDRSSSLAPGSARTSSCSLPRIEDSLEELDRLEDELEAVNAATSGRELAPMEKNPASTSPRTPCDAQVSTITKRASALGQSQTVRIKSCAKASPNIRRVASLTLRDNKPQGSDNSGTSRDKAINLRSTPKSAIKSQRPLTVPKFELPGEAVAKRLREQREARQAQQAEAHLEAQASAAKPRVSRPLAKPTFELPGEAISRRKREEREARLRAEEEEERKRREFKARPVRHSIGPATLPRETVTSRARHYRASQEETEARTKLTRTDKTAHSPAAAARNGQSLPTRGRTSIVLPLQHLDRSNSTSSGTGNKCRTLSAEESEQQRRRSKPSFARDSVLVQDKERDQRERESTARLAREQAAERSRIASREWAEKKRAKETAARGANGQAGVAQKLAPKA